MSPFPYLAITSPGKEKGRLEEPAPPLLGIGLLCGGLTKDTAKQISPLCGLALTAEAGGHPEAQRWPGPASPGQTG